METIKIVKIGWYHPSNANWNWGVYMVIDETGAKIYKEQFGGNCRITETMKQAGWEIIQLYGIKFYGQYKGRDIANMPNIEDYNGVNWKNSKIDQLGEQ